MLRVRDFLTDQQVWRAPGGPTAPAVSVVLPTFCRGAGGGLRRAIDSVLSQSFADLELIVVDDGSRDGSMEQVLEIQRRDARVVLVRHELNCGLPALRVDEGIELARGRWSAFQFDDDEWLPGALAALMAGADGVEGPTVRFGRSELVWPDGTREVIPAVAVDPLTLSFQNRLANNAVLVPTELLRSHGAFDPHVGMRRLCDWDLWLRLCRHADFVAVDALVARVAVGSDAAALGASIGDDPQLFRYLQSIPRDRVLALARWREYEVDSLRIAGVPTPAALGERLARLHLEPWRQRLRHAFPQLTGAAERGASPGPRLQVLASDAYYNSLDLCLGHYDRLGLERRGIKQLYQPLVQLQPGWTGDLGLLLLVRAVTPPASEAIAEAAVAGRPTAYYLDDDLLHLHEYGEPFANLAPGEPRHREVVRQLGAVDAVWSTSEVVSESVRPHNPRVVPHNGAVPADWLPVRLAPRGASGRIRIGYVGTGYRGEEFSLLWDGLRAVSARWGDRIELEFWGLDVSGLPPLHSVVRQRPFSHSFRLFADRLRDAAFDVLLTPLLDHPRPRLAKAPSKYYLTALAGALGIFSDVPPYAPLPQGLTCLKAANRPADWEAALEEALAMPPARFDAMRRAMVDHVRLEYTEQAQIHLHEAAIAATALHAATRYRRVDGRPPVLFAFVADAAARDGDQLVHAAALAREYGTAPTALCAGDAIELQARLGAMGLPWEAVDRPLLSSGAGIDVAVDAAPLRALLERLRPVLVQGSGEAPGLARACAELAVPWVAHAGPQGVPASLFADGLRRVLSPAAAQEGGAAPPLVVLSGDVEPSNRQLVAIEAMARPSNGAAPRLRLWGSTALDPAYANRCRRRIHELGLADRVEMLRPVDDGRRAFDGADLLLDLADDERLPVAVGEALAAGVPSLSASPGSFAAGLIDGLTAWRLAGATAEEVAQAVAGVLARGAPERARIARCGYGWARGELHPQRTASELLQLYGRALDPSSAAGAPAARVAASVPTAAAATASRRGEASDTAAAADAVARGARTRARQLSKALGVYRPLSRAYWRTRRKRILVLAEGPSVSLDLHYQRVLPELEQATGRRWLVRRPAEVDGDDLYSCHAVIAVRGTTRDCARLLARARRFGCRTVYDADDNLLLLAEAIGDPDNPWRRTFDAARPQIEAMLRDVDVVKTYAPSAPPYFASLNPRVVSIRAPHTAFTSRGAPPPAQRPVKVGFVGSSYKDDELAPLLPAIQRLLDERLPLCFEFFGFLPAALRDEPRVAHVPFRMPYARFRPLFEELEWDVGLAPLRDLPYNRCKSDNKYREYASSRAAGVYADMPVYRESVRDRDTGLLVPPADSEAWYRAIRELVLDDALRGAIAERAYADVRASYRPAAYAREVAALLEGPLPPPLPAAPA